MPSRLFLFVLGDVMEIGDWVVYTRENRSMDICGEVIRLEVHILPKNNLIWVRINGMKYASPTPFYAKDFQVVPEAVTKIINSKF